MEPAAQLAEFLGMPVDLLQPCLVQPLPKPDLDFATNSLNSELPQLYSGLLRICNGFTLFPDHPYGPISFWGTSDLLADAKFDDDIVKQSITRGFCPNLRPHTAPDINSDLGPINHRHRLGGC